MSEPVKVNLKIYQGSTFTKVFRWELPVKVYKTISAIFTQAPLLINSTAHGMPVGWRFKLSNISGTKELNTDDYLIVSDKTADSVTVNEVNAVGYTPYVSGGIIEYNEPRTLTGLTARMQIREKLSSTTTVLELTTENSGIVIDDSNKKITVNISATQTTAFTFKSAVYSLEIVDGSTVIPFVYGSITLDPEITR
jgi:hypothetical protein